MSIHPTAIVEDGARLGDGVTVGPHALIGGNVAIGERTALHAGVVITGHTEIGDRCVLHPGVVVGGPPQDLSYAGEPTRVEIGNDTVLREHVTVNAGTARSRGVTRVGDRGYLMVGAHVGHDCIVGDNVILSNNVLLAGHCILGDHVLIGGGAAIVQRVRIGSFAFISGLSGVTRDVIPYAYVIGHRGRLDSLNLVGLKRQGFDRATIRTLRSAYDMLFTGEGVLADRLARLEAEFEGDAAVARILEFVRAGGNRPLLQPLPERLAAGDPSLLEAGV